MLNHNYYNHILSQFEITVIFNQITAYIADLTSIKVIRFCTATLECVDRMTNVPYMEHKNYNSNY